MDTSAKSTEPTAGPQNGQGAEAAALQQQPWSPRFWENSAHVGIRFDTSEELDAAIDWLWSAPEMRDVPRVHVGDNTMIIPAAAMERFRKNGYHFTVRKVVSAGDLSAEEVNRILRQSVTRDRS